MIEADTEDRDWLPMPRRRQPLVEFDLAHPPPAWMRFGACAQPEFIRQHGYDFMFKSRGVGGRTREQKRVCAACPVRLLCEDAGYHEPWGVWGGITRLERIDRGGGMGLPYDYETGRMMAGARSYRPHKKGSQ